MQTTRPGTAFLQDELERLFDLSQLQALSRSLGLDPLLLCTDGSKPGLAAALLTRATDLGAVEALCDVIADSDPRVQTIRLRGFRGSESIGVGATLWPYRIDGELGVGELGTVFLASQGGERVRLKLLAREVARDRVNVERQLARARASSVRALPGSERVLFAGELADRIAIVAEHTAGQLLSERHPDDTPQRLRHAWPILRGTLDALIDLHARQLVHGSLCAANVAVAEGSGQVRLLDAGSHFLRRPSTRLSPEQILGSPPTSHSDLYAFGVLLYELLTGRPPFAGTEDAVARGHLTTHVDPPSFSGPSGSVDPELDELVLDLLDKSPEQRPDAERVRDLLSVLAGRAPRSEHPPGLTESEHQIQTLLANPSDELPAAVLESGISFGADPRRVADAFIAAAERLDTISPARHRLVSRAAELYEIQVDDALAAERAYRRLVDARGDDETGWEGLERLCRRRGGQSQLAELLIERIESEPRPTDRARVLVRLGRMLSSELHDPPQALVAFVEAFSLDPAREDLVSEIESLIAAGHGTWTDVLSTLVEAARSSDALAPRNALLTQLARWYAARAGRLDLARQCWSEVLASDPTHGAALSELAALHRQAGTWSDLCTVLLQQARGPVTASAARELRIEAAAVRARQLGDVLGAIELLESVVTEDPTSGVANDALLRLKADTGAWREVALTLERWAAVSDGSQRSELQVRLAEVLSDHDIDQDRAVALLRHVLEESPTHARAVPELERIYTRLGRHVELHALLTQTLSLATTPRQQVQLLSRLAALAADEFMDAPAAAVFLERATKLEPSNLELLSRLGALQEGLGQWEQLACTLERHVSALPDGPARVSKLVALGHVFERRLGRPDAALNAYEDALALDPQQTAALDGLARVGAERTRTARLAHGELEEVAGMLEHDVACAPTPRARVEAGLELARLLVDRVGDAGRAQAVLSRVLELDPNHVEAQRMLGDIAYAAGRLGDAVKSYARVVQDARDMTPETVIALAGRYADAIARAGGRTEALAEVERLLQRFPDQLSAWQCAVDLESAYGTSERSVELLRQLLARFGDTLDSVLRASVLARLGDALRRAGKLDEALPVLEEAATLDPTAPDSLRGLRALFEDRRAWPDVIRTQLRQVERAPASARADLWLEIGDFASGTLNDTAAAADAYRKALADRPTDRRILLKLMQAYTAERDWKRLVTTIERLADGAADDDQRAKHLLAAARVTLSELGDRAGASALVDRALANGAASEPVVREAISLKTEAGDAEELRVLLERQIDLAARSADRERAVMLGTLLADLHLSELHTGDAIAVNEAVLRITGDDPAREAILTELYASDPARYLERAVTLEERILARDPRDPAPFRMLRELYVPARDLDGAWCACQALHALGQASPDEDAAYRRYRRPAGLPPDARVSEEDWIDSLVHPDASVPLTAVFSRIQRAVVASRCMTLEAAGFSKDLVLTPVPPAHGVVRSILEVARLLGTQPPVLVRDPQSDGGLRFVPTREPCLALGAAALRPGVPPAHALYLAGAYLAYLRPGFHVRVLLATLPALEAWLLAAIRVIAPRVTVSAELEGPVEEARRQLMDHMTGSVLDWLAGPVAELLKDDAQVSVARWMAGVDLTADRVSLVTCGELPTVLAAIRAMGDAHSSLPVAERTRQLVAYSASRQHLRLRAKLGLAIARADGH